MKKLFLIVAIIVIAILTLYWQYIQSPKYSFLQAKKAIEQHNLASFKKYVDIEGIASSLIDYLLEPSTEEKEQSIWEEIGEEIGTKIAKTYLTKNLKQQIVKYVEIGKFEESDFSLSDLWNNFKDIAYVKKEGKIAYIGLEFFNEKYDTSLILELKMRDKGSYWQIAKISNFLEFMKKLDELVEKYNEKIIEAMEQTLTLESLQKSTSWKEVLFSLKFRNNDELKEIDQYKVKLICKTLDGCVLKRFLITDTNNISPGQIGGGVWSADINTSCDRVLYRTPQSDLDISVEIQYIRFTDGSELKLYKKVPLLRQVEMFLMEK